MSLAIDLSVVAGSSSSGDAHVIVVRGPWFLRPPPFPHGGFLGGDPILHHTTNKSALCLLIDFLDPFDVGGYAVQHALGALQRSVACLITFFGHSACHVKVVAKIAKCTKQAMSLAEALTGKCNFPLTP